MVGEQDIDDCVHAEEVEAAEKNSLLSSMLERIRSDVDAIEASHLGHHHIKQSFKYHDGTPMTPEDAERLQLTHIESIGKLLGADFLQKTSGYLLEQFSTVAGNQRIPNCGNMLQGLLHGFMVAYSTKETESRAVKAMLEIAMLSNEANEIRGSTFAAESDC